MSVCTSFVICHGADLHVWIDVSISVGASTPEMLMMMPCLQESHHNGGLGGLFVTREGPGGL